MKNYTKKSCISIIFVITITSFLYVTNMQPVVFGRYSEDIKKNNLLNPCSSKRLSYFLKDNINNSKSNPYKYLISDNNHKIEKQRSSMNNNMIINFLYSAYNKDKKYNSFYSNYFLYTNLDKIIEVNQSKNPG